jgi:twitching motility protein PilU
MERDQALKLMRDLLALMNKKGGSDLFITAGFPPAMKIKGVMTPVMKQPLSGEDSKSLTQCVMNEKQLKEFEETKECNFAIAPAGIGRFRCNAFFQQGFQGLVARTINTEVPNLDKMNLPPVLKELIMEKNGLILMVGGTGSGKSTSMAAMIDYRNAQTPHHIITLEDPIEYVHPHKQCIVMQREIGVDSYAWEHALHNTLRQAPDVILMGEIRSQETMEFGLELAQTGHLCLATLHANNANQALDRVAGFFPHQQQKKMYADLSLNMRAIISQRLVRTADGGRTAAIEILINSPLIAELVMNQDIGGIKPIMAKSRELGMQTFDQHLFDLHDEGRITYEDALKSADSVNELRLKIKLQGKDSKGKDPLEGLDHLSFQENEEEGSLR